MKYICMLLLWLISTTSYATETSNKNINLGIYLKDNIEFVLTDITNKADELSASPDLMLTTLEQHLEKFVSFKNMAKKTMGKHFKKIKKQDRTAFLNAFKGNLFNVYVKTFLDADILRNLSKQYLIEVNKKTKYTNKKQTRALQEITIINNKTNKNQKVTFGLFYSKKNQKWFVRNLIVDGVNLGINYRNQFNLLYTENKKDMQKVIDAWAAKSEEEASNKQTSTK